MYCNICRNIFRNNYLYNDLTYLLFNVYVINHITINIMITNVIIILIVVIHNITKKLINAQ